MLGDRGEGDVERLCELPNRGLRAGQSLDDGAARRVREGTERRVEPLTLNHLIKDCNPGGRSSADPRPAYPHPMTPPARGIAEVLVSRRSLIARGAALAGGALVAGPPAARGGPPPAPPGPRGGGGGAGAARRRRAPPPPP